MITIHLESSDCPLANKISQLMQHEIATNPNLNGAAFKIEPADYTHITGIDEITGTQLMAQLNHIRNANT